MNQEIRVIIADDDAGSINRLRDDLATFPEIMVIDTCSSPKKVLESMINEQPDILFLDVEMSGMTGIELLERIQPELHTDIKVVFYTAYNKYLLEALREAAFDFLLKPYTMEELKAIIDRYRSSAPKTVDHFDQSLRKLTGHDKNVFSLYTITGLMMVICKRVLLFDYSKEDRCWQMLLTDNSKPQKLRQSTIANELLSFNKAFVQISQDCIVNMNYLSSIENGTLRCRFHPPHEMIERTVSKRYFQKIRERLEKS